MVPENFPRKVARGGGGATGVQPGEPTQNAYIESFNGRLRDECLNDHWFTTLHEAKLRIAAWRKDYSHRRPHSALGYLTPVEFAEQRNSGNLTPGSTLACS